MTSDNVSKKERNGRLVNDEGYSFEEVVAIMVNTPPPPVKKDAKDRARKKRAGKAPVENKPR